MKISTRLILLIALGSSLILGQGCGTAGPGTTVSGGNPAAPPAPPADLPSALRIPKDLGLDLTKVQAAALSLSEDAALKVKDAVPPSGEFSKVVSGIGDTVKLFTDDLSGLLDPYSQLVIPVGTNITKFQGLSLIQAVGKLEFVEIKIDFSDFDFDGNGHREGCSGHTAALPICMRIYADNSPEMAAVFTDFPTETNPGAGRMMGLNLTHAVFLFPKGDFLGINYDVHDPAAGKSVEFLVRTNPDNPDGGGKGIQFHMSLDQQGAEATALKTLNINFEFSEAGTVDATQGVARWKEDQDLWSGTIHKNPPDPSLDITDQCVQLSTGDGVDVSQCVTLGIDVGGLDFAAFPDETNLFLPKDFPDSPLF